MKGEPYKAVLDHHLLPFIGYTAPPSTSRTALLYHKTKLVMNRLKEMEKGFTVLDWPGDSLDLNSITNCWTRMKRKLKAEMHSTTPCPS